MFFNKIKNKLYSKANNSLSSPGSNNGFTSTATTVPAPPSPLNPLYTVYKSFKTKLANYDTIKSKYNPHQLHEQAKESGYDPYFSIDTQEPIYVPEIEEAYDDQEFDKIQDTSDKTKGMNNNIDKTTDVYCDPFENTDTAVPVSERLFAAATSTAGSVANNVLWGAMTAVHCVSKGKKTVENCYKDCNKTRNNSFPSESYTLFDDRKPNTSTVAMRGYGVDFAPIFDKSPYMQAKIDASEKRIYEMRVAEREAMFNKSGSDGGKHTRYPIDETWGFIEYDYTVHTL